MIIQCPECNKKYQVPEGAIVGSGRLVRCVACEYEWLARPDDDHSIISTKQEDESSFSQLHTDDAQPQEDYTLPRSEQSLIAEGSSVPESPSKVQERDIKPGGSLVAAAASLKTTIEDLPRAKGLIPPIPRPGSQQMLAVFVCIVLSLLTVIAPALLIWRDQVADITPTVANFLQSLGIHDSRGLKISKIELVQKPKPDHIEVGLVVAIVNLSQEPRFIKALRFGAYDEEMEPLGEVIIEINKSLGVGEKKEVQGRLQRLPLGTAYISADIGDAVEMQVRDMQRMYSFLK